LESLVSMIAEGGDLRAQPATNRRDWLLRRGAPEMITIRRDHGTSSIVVIHGGYGSHR